MNLVSLSCSKFRNLKDIDLDFGSKFIIFSGKNGSGKTSLLEAIYFLTHARSFRTSSLKKLICHGEPSFSLFSKLSKPGESVGIERDDCGKQKIRFSGETINSITPVAQLLPLQFLDTDAHRMLASSPSNRRKFLDWGVFHVEQFFARDWQIYQKILKQRNHVLKYGGSSSELDAWTLQLAEYGEKINTYRKEYVESFNSVFVDLWNDLMPMHNAPELSFYPGWVGGTLEEELALCLDQDKRFGYTTIGPHRCDLRICQGGINIFDFFSQGQQKSLIYALKVSQGVFLKNKLGKDVVYLIDDLPAELDHGRLELVLNVLKQHASQVFITAIDHEYLLNAIGGGVSAFNISSGIVKDI